MTERMTKQGVRDLNLPGHNGHRSRGNSHRHFYGPMEVIGYRSRDPWDWYEATPRYGQRCLICGGVREC